MTSSDSEMDDHKSYHDDPPTYEETMAGIIPPPPDEISPPRRSESSASETSTARPGINRSYWRLDTDLVIFKVSSWIPEQTKAKKSRNKRFDISDYNDSSVILFRMDSCTRSTICSLKKIQLKNKTHSYSDLFSTVFCPNLMIRNNSRLGLHGPFSDPVGPWTIRGTTKLIKSFSILAAYPLQGALKWSDARF